MENAPSSEMPTAAEFVERRKHRRYRCEGLANVLVANGTVLVKGDLVDLSLCGCLVRTAAPVVLERGTYVEIVLSVNNVSFRIAATVMGARAHSGTGIGFLRLNPRIQNQMELLLQELEE
jgi:hypothetical protein